MNQRLIASLLAFVCGLGSMSTSAVEFCNADGLPKGCVVRPVANTKAGLVDTDKKQTVSPHSNQDIKNLDRPAKTAICPSGKWEKNLTTNTSKCSNSTNSGSSDNPKP